MYNPPTFLTVALLFEVLAEFDWPARYALEDDLPDGVSMMCVARSSAFGRAPTSGYGLRQG